MQLLSIKQLNMHAGDWIKRFELWHSIWNDLKKENKMAFSLTAGGRSLYFLKKK